MFNLLKKLRAKPEKTKKRYAFLGAVLISGLIFVVWLTVILPDFRRNESKQAQVAKLAPGPLSSFTGTFSSGVKSIVDKFTELKSSVSGIVSSPAHYSTTTSDGQTVSTDSDQEYTSTTTVSETYSTTTFTGNEE